MARKIMMEVTQPVQDPVTGMVIYQPGVRFAEDAKELEDLPAGSARPVIVESEDEAPASPTAPRSKPGATK